MFPHTDYQVDNLWTEQNRRYEGKNTKKWRIVVQDRVNLCLGQLKFPEIVAKLVQHYNTINAIQFKHGIVKNANQVNMFIYLQMDLYKGNISTFSYIHCHTKY